MRTLAIALVALSLLAIAPAAEAAPPSGADCDVQEEYVTEATVDSSDPTDPVKPGYYTPLECYY